MARHATCAEWPAASFFDELDKLSDFWVHVAELNCSDEKKQTSLTYVIAWARLVII
jgi:hypothetical protein